MLKMPRPMYEDLNGMLVVYADSGGRADVIENWLARFAVRGPA
jgi:hypothetical protein